MKRSTTVLGVIVRVGSDYPPIDPTRGAMVNRVRAVVVMVVVLVDLALHAPEPLPIAPLQERVRRRRGSNHRRRGSGLRRVSGCSEQPVLVISSSSAWSFSIVVAAGAVDVIISTIGIILLHHLLFLWPHLKSSKLRFTSRPNRSHKSIVLNRLFYTLIVDKRICLRLFVSPWTRLIVKIDGRFATKTRISGRRSS